MRFSLPRLSVRADWRTPARTCGAGCRLRGAACGEAAASAPRTRSSASVAPALKWTRAIPNLSFAGGRCAHAVWWSLAPQSFGLKVQVGLLRSRRPFTIRGWLLAGCSCDALVVFTAWFAQSPACALCCQCGTSLRSACELSDTMLVANALLQQAARAAAPKKSKSSAWQARLSRHENLIVPDTNSARTFREPRCKAALGHVTAQEPARTTRRHKPHARDKCGRTATKCWLARTPPPPCATQK